MNAPRLELLIERDEARVRLYSPAVGEFTCARATGDLLAAGSDAGVLLVLGRAHRLVVPAGAEGRITSARPERIHAPVGHRTLLYELAPVDAAAPDAEARDASTAQLGLVFRSPQSGRFYHSPAPGEPPFATPGSALEDGTPVGMIEVMKTFAVVPYRSGGGLPKRARVARLIAGDGTDVAAGDPLVELE